MLIYLWVLVTFLVVNRRFSNLEHRLLHWWTYHSYIWRQILYHLRRFCTTGIEWLHWRHGIQKPWPLWHSISFYREIVFSPNFDQLERIPQSFILCSQNVDLFIFRKDMQYHMAMNIHAYHCLEILRKNNRPKDKLPFSCPRMLL